MSHKERWLQIQAALTVSGHGMGERPGARPTLLPMLLKERWFGDRAITIAANTHDAAPAPMTMANKERPLLDRAPPTAITPEKLAATVPIPMAVKEKWFRSRIFAAPGPAPSPKYAGGAILPKGGGRQQLGKPYKVADAWFVPKEEPGYDASGIASWYGPQFHRRMTANGEWFDMEYLSAAHPTLPLPSYVKITNLDNGSEVIVRVNDRGPFAVGRIIDVSKKCAETLGFKDRGTANVRVQYVGSAPLDDRGGHLRAVNRELRRGTPLARMIVAADIAARKVATAAGSPAKTF